MIFCGSPSWSSPHSFDWSSVVSAFSFEAASADAPLVVGVPAVDVVLPDVLHAATLNAAMASHPTTAIRTDGLRMPYLPPR